MPNDDRTIELARYIFTTGKAVHDYLFREQCRYLNDAGDLNRGLSMAQYHAVSLVHEHAPLSVTELAELLGVSPPSVSAMVDRLVGKGILLRKQCPEDRRKVVIQVAPEALDWVQDVFSNLLRAFLDLIEKIGPETALIWCDVLCKIKNVLDAGASEPKEKK